MADGRLPIFNRSAFYTGLLTFCPALKVYKSLIK